MEMKQSIKEKIQQRRLQILVHSCIYYEFDTNIVDDHTYNRWAHELADLQQQYPEEASQGLYAEAFKDFDGSTGFDLPKDDFVRVRAKKLLEIKDKVKKPEVVKETKKRGRLF